MFSIKGTFSILLINVVFSIKSTFSILLINLAFRLCLASRVTFSIPSQTGCECSDELVFLSFSFQCAAAAIFTACSTRHCTYVVYIICMYVCMCIYIYSVYIHRVYIYRVYIQLFVYIVYI